MFKHFAENDIFIINNYDKDLTPSDVSEYYFQIREIEAYWETLQYDAAANLLDRRRGEEESNQNLIRFNQLLSFRGLKYSYDEHGRTRSKQTASGTQYYHYDAEHRLTEVRIEQLNHTERYGYVYDALGRRIENTGWIVTASRTTAPPSCGTGCK